MPMPKTLNLRVISGLTARKGTTPFLDCTKTGYLGGGFMVKVVIAEHRYKDVKRKLSSIQGTHLLDDFGQLGDDGIDLRFGCVSTEGKADGALC